jgi:hypothetical protein
MTPVLTREDELCLLLARGKLSSEERIRALQFLGTPLQWPLLLERAYSHQVYPLVYRNLLDLGFPGVPEEVQAELKGAYLANAFRNQLLAEELTRLLKLLGEAGIPVVPLKGVTLAVSLFGDSAARVCSDIDILVPPGEAVRARNVILRNGYSSQFTEEFFVRKAESGPGSDSSTLVRPCNILLALEWLIYRNVRAPCARMDVSASVPLVLPYHGRCGFSKILTAKAAKKSPWLETSARSGSATYNALRCASGLGKLCVRCV